MDVPLISDITRGVEVVGDAAIKFMQKYESDINDSRQKNSRRTNTRRPHLPVLIIPGFMSSGLNIEKTDLIGSWEGRRLWLNLKSLGLEKFYNNEAKSRMDRTREISTSEASEYEVDDYAESNIDDNDDDEAAEHVPSRNLWIKHISLSPRDLKSDPPGIQVRPMEGLAGVDYLTPGTLTNFLSYVFGPVINALVKQGYENGVNLDAAPYDWRLAPVELERRDRYFSNTMKKVEELYKKNSGVPVVLVCHSLGCKVGQYFLDFAHARDKTWCDKYIHTYMPIGAPHLGAPFALRGILSGDKMGLEAFLNDSEALAMSRTLGSIPWMIPSAVPSYSIPNVFVRCEGAFEIYINSIVNVRTLFEGRVEDEIPQKLKLVVRYGKRTLATKFVPLVDNEVHFEGKFIFSTGPEGPYAKQCCAKCWQCCILRCACCACCSDNHLIISIKEPGVNETRRTKKGAELRQKCCSVDSRRKWLKIIFCWWIIKYVFILYGYLIYFFSYKLWLRVADMISRMSGGSTQLAVCAPIDLRDFVDETGGCNVEVEFRDDLEQSRYCRKESGTIMPTMNVNVRWVPHPGTSPISTVSKLSELSDDRYQLIDGLSCKKKDGRDWEYETVSGSRAMAAELGQDSSILKAVSEMYDADPLQPRGSLKPPPVKNVKAIYGINLPTEVGAVYKRKGAYAERKHKVKSKYELDKSVKYKTRNGYLLDDGVFYETKDTPQMIEALGTTVSCCGDGTVPYWSLQHVRNWKSKHCNVEVTELEGARHREILADKRFHEVLIDYVTLETDDVPV